ncbi:MAG: DsbA family protein, partial [Alphaproteobacteria bacterium]|nr:DsbA family protein [Alphaproteobacteria bacterium]
TQSEWARAGDPPDVAQALKRLGRQGGLSEEEVTACLSDGEKAQAMVALYQKNAAADGVNSTPSFIINGKLHANMPYSEFSSLIDAELAN